MTIHDQVRACIWVPLLALLIGALVRLVKWRAAPWWLPISVPPAGRVWFAFGLAVFWGLFVHMGGVFWSAAIFGSFAAALLAIVGHDLFIESLRSGRELGEAPMHLTRRSSRPAPMFPPPSLFPDADVKSLPPDAPTPRLRNVP